MGKGRDEILVEAAEALHMALVLVTPDATAKGVHGKKVGRLRKDHFAGVHRGIPSVGGSQQKVGIGRNAGSCPGGFMFLMQGGFKLLMQSDSRGFFSPGLHNTPHAGPHGAFPSEFKGPVMVTFNAGYATSRQCHFTRSGAVRLLRRVRLTRCRRFGPSPCPTHYGGRLATMPSADFCPITPDVAAGRAARVALGSGGDSRAFALALRPAPMATTAPLGFDGDSGPFGPALSSTPIGSQAAGGTDLPG